MKGKLLFLISIRKNSLYLIILIFNLFFLENQLLSINVEDRSSKTIEKEFYNGTNIRLKFLKENIVRIQIVPQDSKFNDTGLNRYGFINELDTSNFKLKTSITKNIFSAETSTLKITVNSSNGNIIVTDPKGEKILLNQIAANLKESSSEVIFSSAYKDENWIGFGDQSRDRVYQRGYVADCNVRDVKSYIPVPFFMSTLGVGVLVNTTRHIVFDMCKSYVDKYSWTDDSGCVDYYLMVGEGYKELLNSYTELTGKPKIPPIWAFGLWYICRTQATDYEAVNDALNFRREGIPCDVIGLEPGWMSKHYDYSTDKKWNNDRFPIASWAPNHNFISAIKRMGFKFELWLCNDYDLSFEEERRINKSNLEFKNKSNQIDDYTANNQNSGSKSKNISQKIITNKPIDSNLPSKIKKNIGFEVDEHLGKIILDKDDTITKKQEPWFDHLKKFIDLGVDFFKQDGALQMNEHPNRLWGNGMSDAEMHNLYPLLYSRQMYEGFKSYTNRRPVVFTPCGWAGFQSWTGTWTGDTGGTLATLGAMINTSIVGHSWATNDMEVTQKEGIHFGYLQPWSQINSWTYFRMPWVQGAQLLAMHKYYGELRSKLIPYLYTWANNSTKTGWPLLLPLTLEFPDEINCRENLHQYLLGRDLMVGIYNKNMYFPAGEWKNYWTGEVTTGPIEKNVTWPADRGGSLYIRSGGIIPFGPVMQYRGEKPMNEITLYIFPNNKESTLNFYEDDGLSFEYLEGKYTTTKISTKKDKNEIAISIGATEGFFKGKIVDRIWNIILHADSKPTKVLCNELPIKEDNYFWNENRKELTINGISNPANIKVKK